MPSTLLKKLKPWNWLASITLFMAFLPHWGYGNKTPKIKETILALNPLDSHELQSQYGLGFVFITEKGDTLMTEGFLGGVVKWRELEVYSQHARFMSGNLFFNRNHLAQYDYKVDITVRVNQQLIYQDTLIIPHIAAVELHNQRDFLHPTEDLRLELTAVFSNGARYHSNEHDVINWTQFVVEVDSQQINPWQYYLPYRKERPTELGISAYYAPYPKARGELKLPIVYGPHYILNFSGSEGEKGENGADGLEDQALEDRHGLDGWPGEDGYNGMNVNLAVKAEIQEADTLLHILLITDQDYRYLPLGAEERLTLNLNGGNGGRGGNGGEGADAHPFAKRIWVYEGSGGNGARSGNGGNGGASTLFTDSLGAQCLYRLQVLNLGGSASKGGFYGKAGKPMPDSVAQLKNLQVWGEHPGIDGQMGSQGIPGKDGPAPTVELISRQELEALLAENR